MERIDNIEMTEEFKDSIKVFLTDESYDECFLVEIKGKQILMHTTEIVSLVNKLNVALVDWIGESYSNLQVLYG